MLYDTRWEHTLLKEHQVGPPHLLRLIAWLETKPPHKSYDYTNPFNCGYAQYLRSRAIFAAVSPCNFVGLWLGIVPVVWRVPPGVDNILNSGAVIETFGQALKRARAALNARTS